jgi:hypothetical protein
MQNSHQERNLQIKTATYGYNNQIVPKYKEQLLTFMYPCHMGRRWYTSDPIMLTYKHLSHKATTAVYWRSKKKKMVSSVCTQEVTSCCTSASVASSLPARRCLTHCGRVTQIYVCTLQRCKTGDANLRF